MHPWYLRYSCRIHSILNDTCLWFTGGKKWFREIARTGVKSEALHDLPLTEKNALSIIRKAVNEAVAIEDEGCPHAKLPMSIHATFETSCFTTAFPYSIHISKNCTDQGSSLSAHVLRLHVKQSTTWRCHIYLEKQMMTWAAVWGQVKAFPAHQEHGCKLLLPLMDPMQASFYWSHSYLLFA